MILSKSSSKIFALRGELVILDRDLANFYEVPIHRLNEAIKRNKDRFLEESMFQITKEEMEILREQGILPPKKKGGRTYLPYVFSEVAVWTTAGILTSDKAKIVGKELMRTFKAMRDYLRSQDTKTLPMALGKVLEAPQSTVNIFQGNINSVVFLGEKSSFVQTIHLESSLEGIEGLKAILPKDQEELSKMLDKLTEALKEKNGPAAKEILSTVETGISAVANAPAAFSILRALMPSLEALANSLF